MNPSYWIRSSLAISATQQPRNCRAKPDISEPKRAGWSNFSRKRLDDYSTLAISALGHPSKWDRPQLLQVYSGPELRRQFNVWNVVVEVSPAGSSITYLFQLWMITGDMNTIITCSFLPTYYSSISNSIQLGYQWRLMERWNKRRISPEVCCSSILLVWGLEKMVQDWQGWPQTGQILSKRGLRLFGPEGPKCRWGCSSLVIMKLHRDTAQRSLKICGPEYVQHRTSHVQIMYSELPLQATMRVVLFP